jgi:hypothetical protein
MSNISGRTQELGKRCRTSHTPCLSLGKPFSYIIYRSDAVANKPILMVDPSEKIKEKTQTLVEGNILNKMKYMEQLKADKEARALVLPQKR